jgi:hypothetical protein
MTQSLGYWLRPSNWRPKQYPSWYRNQVLLAPTIARDPDPKSFWVTILRGYLAPGLSLALLLVHVVDRDARALLACLGWSLSTLGLLLPARWLAAPWVRAGHVRGAFRAMRLTEVDPEARASAVAVAALAAARREKPEPSELEFLRSELTAASPRGSRGVLAHALVSALAGDVRTARALFELVERTPRRLFDGFTRNVATTWLAADDARCGEFERLARRTDPRRAAAQRGSEVAKLFGAAAQRLVGAPDAPSNGELMLTTVLLGQHRAARPLILQALKTPLDSPHARPQAPAATSELLLAALALHRDYLLENRPHERLRALLAAGRGWDAVATALEAGALARIGRDPSLEKSDIEAALALATEDIAVSSLARALPLAECSEESATLARAYDAVCDRLLAELEAHLTPLARRVAKKQARPMLEEWVEWAVLASLLERLERLGGERVRRASFPRVYQVLTSYGVWLYNERHQHRVAHAVFSWLYKEALWAEDEKAIAQSHKNALCRPVLL